MTTWLWFVWAAIAAALTAGFGFGTIAFLWAPSGRCWLALTEAHGHLQLFGWGGLMVIGVGMFFLPRLRGAPLSSPGVLPWALFLLAGGLSLHALVQAACPLSPADSGFASTMVAAGLMQLAGAALAVAVLAHTARHGPPLGTRAGLVQVLPYLVLAFSSLLAAMAANLVQSFTLLRPEDAALAVALRGVVVRLGLMGFLVPISVAVSARSFPLFLWTLPPDLAWLRAGFWVFSAGLLAATAAMLGAVDPLERFGAAAEGVGLLLFAAALRVVPLRRRSAILPDTDPHYVKPVERLLVSSYVWLALAGTINLARGVAPELSAIEDAETHALGSGFVTLLIFGMGARMLPGFSGKRIASVSLVSATLWLGNASALLRVAPLLWLAIPGAGAWPAGSASGTMGVAGLLGIAATACFGLNLWITFSGRGASPGAHRVGEDRR